MSDETNVAQFASGLRPHVAAADDIHRRIHPSWIVADELHPGLKRLSSAAFRPPPTSPCSGYVARECSIADVLGPCVGDSIGAIVAGVLQQHGYQIERDVMPGEHPAHVHLVQPDGLSKSARRTLWTELALRTRWVHGPAWGEALTVERTAV